VRLYRRNASKKYAPVRSTKKQYLAFVDVAGAGEGGSEEDAPAVTGSGSIVAICEAI
jgi:hypothetical protein